MGKNKRRTLPIKCSLGEFEVDSNEEIAFLHWCEEALKVGFIEISKDFFYQPKSFMLFDAYTASDGKSIKTKLREHKYSPDFAIKITDKFTKMFPKLKFAMFFQTENKDDNYVYIDIKGGFMTNGSARSFPITQKWVLAKFNIFINKIFPDELFKRTWLPKEEQFSPKQHKIREKYKDLKLLSEIM